MKLVTFGVFLDDMPGLFGEFHLHEYISGKKLSFPDSLFAANDFLDGLRRNQYSAEMLLESLGA